jgi:hypothetical protein
MNAIPAVLAFATIAAAAGQESQQESRQPPADLRRTVQHYDSGRPPAPRELTPAERAELRRQLSEYGPPRAERRR